MGGRRPHDPRGREGVGKQAGRARRWAVSPPPPPPGREVSLQACSASAGERIPQPPAPGAKHGGRQGKRRPFARRNALAGSGPEALEARAFTCPVGATGKANRKGRGAAVPPCSSGRREVITTPGQDRQPVRGPRPDLAAETLQAAPSHLARVESRCLIGARRAESRPARRSRCAWGGGGTGVSRSPGPPQRDPAPDPGCS